MLNTLCQLVILFFVFAVLGWCMEVTLKSIQYRRFVNRGFLIGPYCPIYGWGVAFVTVLVGGLIGREGTIVEIFFAGYVLCGALEYFTGWYMEKRFHARWWDYSKKPMNLHGRIWVGNLVLFGLASVVIVLWIDPLFFSLVGKLSPFWLHLLASAIVLLMISDHIATSVLMAVVRKEIDAQEGDNTEEITRQVRLLLRDRHLLLRRIEQAYPELQSQPRWLTLQIKQARKDYHAASHKVTELIRESRRQKGIQNDQNWNSLLDEAMENEKIALRKFRELQKKCLNPRNEDECFSARDM